MNQKIKVNKLCNCFDLLLLFLFANLICCLVSVAAQQKEQIKWLLLQLIKINEI